MDFVFWHFHHCHNGATKLFVELSHLRQHAGAIRVDAQIIRQHHTKGLFTDQGFTGKNGVAQPFHLPLTGVGKSAFINQLTYIREQRFLIGASDLLFQLVVGIKVVFLGTLAQAGHHAGISQIRFQGFYMGLNKVRGARLCVYYVV